MKSGTRVPVRDAREHPAHVPEALASTVPQRERAVLVVLQFAGGGRKLSSAARLARSAALLGADSHDPGHAATAENAAEPDTAHDATLGVARAGLDSEAAAAEFVELAESAGAEVAAVVRQRRARPDPATLVGTGKLGEIEGIVASENADVVLFNHDLSPSQLRNLEAKLPCRVIDRTQLILDIFARHARTREGQMQVELAQLNYQLPRLAGRGRAMSQLGGGIGTRGPGETQLETDRRKIRTRIDHVKTELEGVRRIRGQQRQRREGVPVPVVALVGYTNAGKSTLFNALTGAGVLQSSRMFATLDTTLRQLRLPSRRKVVLSDTVGFIRDLPHTLVTSFRATLEEVERAELLLHVQDAASGEREEHREQVRRVLAEIGVADRAVIEIWNKMDLLPEEERSPGGGGGLGPNGVVHVSALRGQGIGALLDAVDAALVADPLLEVRFRMPQSEGRVLAAIEAGSTLEERRFEGNLVYFTAVGPASLLNRYRRFQATD